MSSGDLSNLLAPDLEFWSEADGEVVADGRANFGLVPNVGDLVEFEVEGDPTGHRAFRVTGRRFRFAPDGSIYMVRIAVTEEPA